ncbi:MAG: formylglycine-generating enzyme family protein [Deltaproteobacteria bacterium]|nr:formylglycine-generating enzyme family protein [Deltaproteobacteria bacterium]
MSLRSFLFVLLGSPALLAIGSFCHGAEEMTNAFGMEFVLIPAGSFVMGVDEESWYGSQDLKPEHKVVITKPFYLGKYEVTQAQWEAVMGDNPSAFKGERNPVDGVSWNDAQAFIAKLNAQDGARRYRLPTEAEWEYVAKYGKSSISFYDPGEIGEDLLDYDLYAWYGELPDGSTHPVGLKEPNPWGVYDILGNVMEWVGDYYGETYYAESPEADPQGPAAGAERVTRGGYWRLAYASPLVRFIAAPDERDGDEKGIYGFRVAFTAP